MSTATARLGMREEGNAFLGFMERQKNLYKRYWVWEVVWLVYSLVSVMSIGYLASGLDSLPVATPQSHVDLAQAQLYLLVGSVMWGYLSLVFFEVAYGIAWERWEGTIEYTFMAPCRRATHLLGIGAFAIVYGTLRTALVVAITVMAFHVDLSHANLLSATVVLVAATPALLGLGIMVAILPLLSPEKGEQMTFAVQGILLLVSGVYYPLSVLPAAFQALGHLSPMTYALSGIRDALLGGASLASLLPRLGLLVLMGAAFIGGGMVLFGRAEQRAKRLGTLKRSG